MTPEQWVAVVSSIGLPGAALYLLAKWTAKRLETAELLAQKREDEQQREISEVRTELKALESEVRNQLVTLLRETKVALRHNTLVLKQLMDSVPTITIEDDEDYGIEDKRGGSSKGKTSKDESGDS